MKLSWSSLHVSRFSSNFLFFLSFFFSLSLYIYVYILYPSLSNYGSNHSPFILDPILSSPSHHSLLYIHTFSFLLLPYLIPMMTFLEPNQPVYSARRMSGSSNISSPGASSPPISMPSSTNVAAAAATFDMRSFNSRDQPCFHGRCLVSSKNISTRHAYSFLNKKIHFFISMFYFTVVLLLMKLFK